MPKKCKWGEKTVFMQGSSAWMCRYKVPLSMVAVVGRICYDRMKINECLCTPDKCRCYEEV